MSFAKCVLCETEFENLFNPRDTLCSEPCKSVDQFIDTICETIFGTRPTDDKRIFFYPLSFGQLIDRYTVLALRRSHTKSIQFQQETDYHLFKLNRSIQTHLGQLSSNENLRSSLAELTDSLFKVNSHIWSCKEKASNPLIPIDDMKDALLVAFELGKDRLKLIQQLDILASGKTTEYQTYNGSDL